MTAQTLEGRKVLITAYDLEQSEHRGIAVYSNSLMRCLHEAGAEVWLLTEFFDKLSEKGLKRLPKSTQAMIHNARILNSLAMGRRGAHNAATQVQIGPQSKAMGKLLESLLTFCAGPEIQQPRSQSFSTPGSPRQSLCAH